nr:protein phosphatase 1 regulatory subunit 1C isoform X2 [Anolis sagrei ordinatus]
MWEQGVSWAKLLHSATSGITAVIIKQLQGVCQGVIAGTISSSSFFYFQAVLGSFCFSIPILTVMEPNSPKKIQFAVPVFQSQIDPEAAEQIRKRRPTPASLVIMTDSPPEIDEKRMNNNSQDESQNASPKQRKQSVYTPPAMKGTVQGLNI